ncbi:MAG: hypothetical protein K2L45_11430 [Muribaculaceae bacterium]|nr:hypothetical protein [Muribaculaceae bacterium]MDE6631414.1 hypothetical protein [Muribaculaceae bacterium]
MKKIFLALAFVLICGSFSAKKLNGKVVREGDSKGVGYARLAVEYPDTIINYEADRKGRFSFEPSSFPLTITARAEGMTDATYGFMSMPPKTVKLEIEYDPTVSRVSPRRRVDWSSDWPRRLRSTYIVRTH